MRIQPNSTITLYQDIPVDNGEQLVFASAANRERYFQNHMALHGIQTPVTVVRKNGALRVELTPNGLTGAILSTCNYLSFINPSFDDKIIYARIIDYDYVNNEVAEIAYAIDYWLTWMFDVSFDDCYIEREHLSVAEKNIEIQNPYDSRLYSLRTPEPSLGISEDLEKQDYSISYQDSNDVDGVQIGEMLTRSFAITQNTGTLIILSSIDFADLDAEFQNTDVNSPSYKFKSLVENSTLYGLGYYYLTADIVNYINGRYTGHVPGYINLPVNGKSSGWNNIFSGNPGPSPRLKNIMGCSYIYYDDPYYDGSLAHGDLDAFLGFLVRESCVSAIAGMFAVPNTLMALCAANVAEQVTAVYLRSIVGDLTRKHVDNMKLALYPFSYLRLITPNGDKKELKFEYFNQSEGSQSFSCELACYLDVSDQPSLIIAPCGYRMSGISYGDGNDANIDEALVYQQFPTKPYMIDSYLAQCAASANQVMANRTVDAAYDLTQQVETNKSWLQNLGFVGEAMGKAGRNVSALGTALGGSDMGRLVSGVGGAIGDLASSYKTGVEQFTSRGKAENAANQWMGAKDFLAGGDGAIVDNLRATRPAYACNKYVRSNGSGFLNFNLLSFFDVIALRVQLQDEIIIRYDEYFTRYGYASGRCGIPWICNYIAGVHGNDLPSWHTVNGRDTTYVKTTDCHVVYANLPVAEAIKQMFNNGVRFIKGDLN